MPAGAELRFLAWERGRALGERQGQGCDHSHPPQGAGSRRLRMRRPRAARSLWSHRAVEGVSARCTVTAARPGPAMPPPVCGHQASAQVPHWSLRVGQSFYKDLGIRNITMSFSTHNSGQEGANDCPVLINERVESEPFTFQNVCLISTGEV